jgi:Fibronectin type III domain
MTTTIKKLKALFDFLGLPSDSFVSRLTQIHDRMLGNPAFPNSPVDLAVFLAAITTFSTSVVASLDGSKQAIAIMKKQREGLVKMAEQLGHYVEAVSNNDPATFISSGFEFRSTARVPQAPPAQPVIDTLDQGKTGELLVTVSPVANARIYEIEYAPVTTNGTAPGWTKITVATARKPVPVENLTPGTTYTFHVRAFGKSSFTDWCQPVQRMVI